MSDAPGAPHTAERLRALATEQPNPETAALDHMSPLEIVQTMNAADATVAAAVAAELSHIADAIAAIAARLRDGGRLIYIGAGTSGRLAALDAIECPPTFGVAPEQIVSCLAGGSFALDLATEDVEDDSHAGAADLARLGTTARDAVVGVSASGRTPYTLGALTYARQQGSLTIGLACNPATPLAQVTDIMITPLVGPEVVAGSTRLKSGTAQKMALNMLSTGAMVLLGKTYGNLMVDVRATNDKLRARAASIVCQAAGVDDERANTLLRRCDGEVKTAILVALREIEPVVARAWLAASDGSLRVALERPS